MPGDEPLRREDVEELLRFLPILREFEGKTVCVWRGGVAEAGGDAQWPYPDYPPEILEFFRIAAKPCWAPGEYSIVRAREILERGIEKADLGQIKLVLLASARSERFCDGCWAELVSSGKLIGVLERLGEIWSGQDFSSG